MAVDWGIGNKQAPHFPLNVVEHPQKPLLIESGEGSVVRRPGQQVCLQQRLDPVAVGRGEQVSQVRRVAVPPNCLGWSSSPNIRTPTASAAAGPARPTASAWTPSSSSCAPAASGRPWTPPVLPRLHRPRPLPGVGRGRRLPDVVEGRACSTTTPEGHRLVLAEHGRVHDQGTPRGGKRRAKTPPIGPKGRQAQPAGRGRRHAGGPGRGRGQPPRHEDGRATPGRASPSSGPSRPRAAAGDVPGQGVRLRRGAGDQGAAGDGEHHSAGGEAGPRRGPVLRRRPPGGGAAARWTPPRRRCGSRWRWPSALERPWPM